MSVVPLVQFKAGLCEINDSVSPWIIRPKAVPGFIYLYKDEDLSYLCWRPRAAPLGNPGEESLHLSIPPGDGHFEPYQPSERFTNGRIYRLGFESSNAKHFFWLQSKSQNLEGKADYWSERDYSLGKIVNAILNGEDVNAGQLYRGAGDGEDGDGDDESDAEMREVGNDDPRSGAGGAGAGATGGNITEEGEDSRQRGEDGARANVRGPATPADAQNAVASLLRSLQDDLNTQRPAFTLKSPEQTFTTLPDLLKAEVLVKIINDVEVSVLDNLMSELPQHLIVTEATGSADIEEAIKSLSASEKTNMISRVIRSPQFAQSLASLTNALRDGGLPTISDALHIKIANGGYIQRGRIPLGGDAAVEAFMKGIQDEIAQAARSNYGGASLNSLEN